jgi:hypothetical protein
MDNGLLEYWQALITRHDNDCGDHLVIGYSAYASPAQHFPSSRRACAELMPAFTAMRFIPPQGPAHGCGRTTTLWAMDQRRRYRLSRPVQRLSTSRAFRLTPG